MGDFSGGMPPFWSRRTPDEPVVPLGAHGEAAAVLRDDASGLEAALRIGCEGRLELVRPAERGQGPAVQAFLLTTWLSPRALGRAN